MLNSQHKIAFISGHRNITEDEFAEHYHSKIDDAISDGCSFVVGDYEGADYLAQQYLLSRGVIDMVTVFYMWHAPQHIVEGVRIVDGFISDNDRDSAMTIISDFDIAWVRGDVPNSGTEQNINRRIIMDN